MFKNGNCYLEIQSDYSPGREAPLCRQQSSTAPRAHNTGALLFFIHGVQSRFPDIFHTQPPETHTHKDDGQKVIYTLQQHNTEIKVENTSHTSTNSRITHTHVY